MSVTALLVRVPGMRNYITTINKAPRSIRGKHRSITGETVDTVFTRVYMDEEKNVAVYVTESMIDEDSNSNNCLDTSDS